MSLVQSLLQRINISKEDWERKFNDVKVRKEDMNRLVINFLVTAAQSFERESGTERCGFSDREIADIDLQCLRDRDRVKRAVLEGDLEDAIRKVRDFCPQLLDTNPQLLFHLQQQWLIELIQSGKTEEAVEVSRKLAPIAGEDPGLLEEMEKTMVLLAFEDAKKSPASAVELLYPSQRLRIANVAAILTSQKVEKDPKLLSVVRMLIWAQQKLFVKADFPKLLCSGKAGF